jgi:hypothetical protein
MPLRGQARCYEPVVPATHEAEPKGKRKQGRKEGRKEAEGGVSLEPGSLKPGWTT